MIRFLLPVLALIVAAPLRSSRPVEDHNNDKSLYSVALFASLEQMDKEWSHINDAYSGRIRTDYHHMIVHTDATTYEIPASWHGYNVEYLDDAELRARRKTLGKDFASLRVFPLRNQGEVLTIQVTVYWVGLKKKMLMFGLSDWSNVTFRYDCEKKEFVVSGVQLGGI
jgi:hypothetical protein